MTDVRTSTVVREVLSSATGTVRQSALAREVLLPGFNMLAGFESGDTAAVSGTVIAGAITGALAASEPIDAGHFAGLVLSPITGTLITSEASDVAAFAAETVALGILSASEARDTAAFAGVRTYPAITGSLAAID